MTSTVSLRSVLFCLLLVATGFAVEDWMTAAKAAITRNDLPAATAIVNRRLAESPSDWEALGWHARLLAWQGNWTTAEKEYRQVLEHAPIDDDVVMGLSDVLAWQLKREEALETLTRATPNAPPREVLKRRARLLVALGRKDEAKAVYQSVLKIDASDVEAKAALHTTPGAPRYELRIGNDTDSFNYVDTANAQSITLRARFHPRFTASAAGEFFQRFGQEARKLRIGSTVSLSSRDYITVGGAFANAQDVISRYDESVEYGHVFKFGTGFLRGLETSVEQRSLWFTSSRITLLRGGAVAYLPRDWMWSLNVIAARSTFDNAGTSWSPSGSTRLWFPLHRRVQGNVLFAIGSEDYSNIDQIGRFSAHTYGGGLRFQITDRQDFSVFSSHQLRSHERSQTSVGVSYAVRF